MKDSAAERALSQFVSALFGATRPRRAPGWRRTRNPARGRWWLAGMLAGLAFASALLVRRAGAAPSTSVALLHSFSQSAQSPGAAVLIDASGNLYGTATTGGRYGLGAVFRMKPDGTGFTLLHSFAGGASDGDTSYASLVLDASGFLYGTTTKGGSANLGTVFKIKTDGTGFAIVHSFLGGALDGQIPYAALILDGSGYLYGTTYGTGSGGSIVFKVKTDGTGYVVLHPFAGGAADGMGPYAALLLDGSGILYGTTHSGGASDKGTLFRLKTDGTGFGLLHSFAGGASDGAFPQSALITDGSGNLYGTTLNGGGSGLGLGTVFKIQTDGNGFALVHAFSGAEGTNPYYGSLALDAAGFLYGTTFLGGASGQGSVYKVRTTGSGFATIHSFAGGAGDGRYPYSCPVLDASGSLVGTSALGGAPNRGTVFRLKTDGTGFGLPYTFTTADGGAPDGSLLLDSSGFLYGTTHDGGDFGLGAVFKIKVDGTAFAVLHSFVGGASDGQSPYSTLIADGSGFLYGTTHDGGSSASAGTVFRIKTDGTSYALIHSFSGGAADGGAPQSGVILDGAGFLYGTTFGGGSAGQGTVYKVKTDRTGFALLHSFTGGAADGLFPEAALMLDNTGFLYGTTHNGGISDQGTVFKIKTDGTGFALLHSFAGGLSDGAYPQAPVIRDASGFLYGTTVNGGSSSGIGQGIVFKIRPDGMSFASIHAFTGSDGANPFYGSLLRDGAGFLYGSTFLGGDAGQGALFRVKTDGTGFAVLHSFVGGAFDGRYPVAGLVSDGAGNLYGTTSLGGIANLGTVFSLPSSSPPPPTATFTPSPTSTPPPTRTPNPLGYGYFAVAPCRIVDTRNPDGPLGGPALQAGANRDFTLAGACAIPKSAAAVSVNVTVTQAEATGNLTLFSAGSARPATSTINYGAGQTRANNAVVSPNSNGTITVRCNQTSGSVQFVLDVNGYYQ